MLLLLLLLCDRQLPDLPLAQRLPPPLTGEQPKLLLLLFAQVVAISETEKHSKEISVQFYYCNKHSKEIFDKKMLIKYSLCLILALSLPIP